MRSDRTLINFNCPNDLMDSFDEVCDFKSMNRTQTLIELMRDYVVNKSDEIQRWICTLRCFFRSACRSCHYASAKQAARRLSSFDSVFKRISFFVFARQVCRSLVSV